jgi:hypothetical protein
MKFEINEVTNNQEASFGAKLLSMSEKPLENTNGTIYRIANIEFEDINGKTQKSSAMVYEGNYNYGMEIGKTFLAKATLSGDSVYLTVSHLEYNGTRATVDMFGFEAEATAPAAAPVKATSRSKQVITEDELADF